MWDKTISLSLSLSPLCSPPLQHHHHEEVCVDLTKSSIITDIEEVHIYIHMMMIWRRRTNPNVVISNGRSPNVIRVCMSPLSINRFLLSSFCYFCFLPSWSVKLVRNELNVQKHTVKMISDIVLNNIQQKKGC